MGRLLLLFAVFIGSFAGYSFVDATALPTDRPVLTAQAAEFATATPMQISTDAPATVRRAATMPARSERELLRESVPARVALRITAAHADGPPRGTLNGTSRKLPMLHLPSTLPNRTVYVPILMYHHVSSVAPLTNLNYGLTVTGENFTAQLEYLRAHGFHTVLLRQVFAAMYQGAKLPGHPIVLTFDDGYIDNYTDALPILRKFHDVAEFNIISAYAGISVGINSYMTWNQLKKLVASGMEIGSHTVDHQDLGTLTTDKVRFELRDSRNVLQQKLGTPVQFLAYPSGEPFDHGSLATQQRILNLVAQYGYVGALLDGPLTSSAHDTLRPFQLWRIRVAGGEGIGDFAASLRA